MALTFDQAQRALAAAIDKASSIGSPSSIAIVDGGRELVAFARQDAALLASTEIAMGKAYTACSMKMATKDIGPLTQPGAPLYGLENTHLRPLVTFGGGQPIQVDGEVVGAVGVAGGTPDQDDAIALAASAAVANS